MVVHEVVQFQSVGAVAAHAVETFHRMGDLEIVVVVVAGVQGFVQMIVGHGMQCALVDPTGVIPMDDLAHEPELGLDLVCHMTQRFHEIKIQHIGGIQTYAVNVKLADPEADHIADIVPHRRIALVQLHQQVIATPVFIGKSVVVLVVTPEIHIAVPVFVRGIFPIFFVFLESKKVSACVVKHAVQNHPDARLMAFCHKVFQIPVVPQAAVQLFVIRGLIAVSHGFKQGPYVQGVHADLP